MSTKLLADVAVRAEVRTLAAGETLFRLGDPGEELFVVADGELEILVPARGAGEERIATVGAGGWTGEMAVITGEARSATARAAVSSTLVALSRPLFRFLVANAPEVGLRLSDELSRRLRGQLTGRRRPPMPRVVVVTGTVRGVLGEGALARFVTVLEREVGSGIAVLGDPAAAGGPMPASAPVIANALRHHRLVVVFGGTGPSIGGESRACVSAAEVAAAVEAEERLSLPPFLSGPLRQLARALLRRRVGLVLGAGGAKGLCHLGVLKALGDAALSVDLIVGTSIGALVGGFAAMPHTIDGLRDGFGAVARDFRRRVIDPQIFGASLLRGRKKTRVLREYALERDIADLAVPFHAVTTDLVTGRAAVLSDGPLWQALDASSAVPTIFPPVAAGRGQLVDGWMLNPVASDVACREGANVVIAVDPSASDRAGWIPPGAPSLHWPRSLHRFADVGGRFRMAMRAMEVSARDRAAANRSLVDVAVEPRVGRYRSTDVGRFEAIVAAGEEAMRRALPALRSLFEAGDATAGASAP